MGKRRFKQRCFSESDKEEFLKALGESRNRLLKLEHEFALEKPLHSACRALTSAVDDTAEILTGDRTYFHAKHFGSSVGPSGFDFSPRTDSAEHATSMPGKWCTVTVIASTGQRFSIDVLATSTYDAAHLYANRAKTQTVPRLPCPTISTIFEVTIDGKVHIVKGSALVKWIQQKR